MKVSFLGKLSMVAASALVCASVSAADITGAGATFPYPIYAKWAEAYKAKTGISLNYQAIGSGGGIKQIKAKTVDFGASDEPLKAEDLKASGLVQFPAILGGVVPVVNLEGIKAGQLKMSGDVLADIYLGKITKWNDSKITAMNPGHQFAGFVHYGRTSCRRFGNVVFVDRLSVQGQPRIQTESRCRQGCQMADRCWRQG